MVEYADFALNSSIGCSNGCLYPCYAMKDKKVHGIKNYADWIKPKIVSNAMELLEKEIPKYKKDIKSVFLSFFTDPFMYQQKEICDWSLKIIKRLNKDNLKSIVLTKGILPKQLAQKEIYGANIEVGITLVSPSEDFRKRFEPGAAPIIKRIEALKYLHDAGLKTFFSMEPFLTPNLSKQDLEELLKAISRHKKMVFGRWNGDHGRITEYLKRYPYFYEDAAQRFIEFCEKKKIKWLVKEGTTKKNYNIENPKLFFVD